MAIPIRLSPAKTIISHLLWEYPIIITHQDSEHSRRQLRPYSVFVQIIDSDVQCRQEGLQVQFHGRVSFCQKGATVDYGRSLPFLSTRHPAEYASGV